MDELKEYEITVRVRNNYLWTAIKRAGHSTVASLCRAHPGLKYGTVINLLALARPALGRNGDWIPSIKKLAAVLNTPPEALVPPAHWEECLAKNSAKFEASFDDIQTFLGKDSTATPLLPDQRIERQELSQLLASRLAQLTLREARVLAWRFGLRGEDEKTLEQIAEIEGVGQERIRQIEARALRKLRRAASTDKGELVKAARSTGFKTGTAVI